MLLTKILKKPPKIFPREFLWVTKFINFSETIILKEDITIFLREYYYWENIFLSFWKKKQTSQKNIILSEKKKFSLFSEKTFLSGKTFHTCPHKIFFSLRKKLHVYKSYWLILGNRISYVCISPSPSPNFRGANFQDAGHTTLAQVK